MVLLASANAFAESKVDSDSNVSSQQEQAEQYFNSPAGKAEEARLARSIDSSTQSSIDSSDNEDIESAESAAVTPNYTGGAIGGDIEGVIKGGLAKQDSE